MIISFSKSRSLNLQVIILSCFTNKFMKKNISFFEYQFRNNVNKSSHKIRIVDETNSYFNSYFNSWLVRNISKSQHLIID